MPGSLIQYVVIVQMTTMCALFGYLYVRHAWALPRLLFWLGVSYGYFLVAVAVCVALNAAQDVPPSPGTKLLAQLALPVVVLQVAAVAADLRSAIRR